MKDVNDQLWDKIRVRIREQTTARIWSKTSEQTVAVWKHLGFPVAHQLKDDEQ